MSDRIAVMNDGRVEQIGGPREIYDHPSTPFVADFIGSLNALELVVDELVGGLRVMRATARASGSSSPPARTCARATSMRVAVRPERVRIDCAGSPAARGRSRLGGNDRRGRVPRHVHAVPRRDAGRARSCATASRTRLSRPIAVGTAVVLTWEPRSDGRAGAPAARGASTSSRIAEPALGDPAADLGYDHDDQRTVITTTATAITSGSRLGKRSAQ